MNISLKHTFITVHDADLALAFYRDVLGLELRNDVAAKGFRWLTVSPPNQPEIEIVLSDYVAENPADSDTLRALLAKGVLNGLVFTTDDLDATFEKVRASGADVLQEPMDQGWGARDCAFRDPSGNLIRIAQR
jgi:catechol 2,3-dioxygenase-like lactoylglutathione lyase family enzyme